MKSLAHQFLDFCRSKPADEKYPFMDCGRCAVGQFVTVHLGMDRHNQQGSDIWCDLHIKYDAAVRSQPCTFGALADRLEQSLSPTLAAAAAREERVA